MVGVLQWRYSTPSASQGLPLSLAGEARSTEVDLKSAVFATTTSIKSRKSLARTAVIGTKSGIPKGEREGKRGRFPLFGLRQAKRQVCQYCVDFSSPSPRHLTTPSGSPFLSWRGRSQLTRPVEIASPPRPPSRLFPFPRAGRL